MWRMKNVKHGGVIAATAWAVILTTSEISEYLEVPQEDREADPAMENRLQGNLPGKNDICMDVIEMRTPKTSEAPKPSKPNAWAEVRDKGSDVQGPWATVYEITHPGPSWQDLTRGDEQFFGPQSFGIVEGSGTKYERVRELLYRRL